MGTIYSQLKPAWHPEQLVQLRKGKQPPPVHVQLILSDLCNQDCGFCAYRMSTGLSSELFAEGRLAVSGHNNPVRWIGTPKAEEIIDDCYELGVKAIQFTGGGEPTVHPDHRDLFMRAHRYGIDAGLVTNGLKMLPTHEAFQQMTWIRVSIDAGSPEDYAAVRRVPEGHWHKVWDNVGTLAATYQGTLGIGFVVTPENYRGIVDCALRARDAGASNMRVGAVFSEEGPAFYGDTIPAIIDTINDAKAVIDGDGFELVDLFGRRLGDLEGGSPEDPDCNYQYFTMYIGGDLNVYRCCNTAYTRAGTVGSLKNQRLKDAVLNYSPFDARQCQFCQFIGQNQAIKGLIKEPTHANFV